MTWTPWVLLIGTFALVHCSYPEFEFRSNSSANSSTSDTSTATTTGTGGSGGASSSADTTTSTSSGNTGGGGSTSQTTTTTTSSTTTTTSSGGGGTLPCAPGPCALPQVCCYHSAYASCDKCADSGDCYDIDACAISGTYTELSCDEATDCFAGGKCCIKIENNKLSSSCKASCAGDPEYEACTNSACPNGGTCTATGYAGYEVCL